MLENDQTDNRVIGILIAHLGAFCSGELKRSSDNKRIIFFWKIITRHPYICTKDYPELIVSSQKDPLVCK